MFMRKGGWVGMVVGARMDYLLGKFIGASKLSQIMRLARMRAEFGEGKRETRKQQQQLHTSATRRTDQLGPAHATDCWTRWAMGLIEGID